MAIDPLSQLAKSAGQVGAANADAAGNISKSISQGYAAKQQAKAQIAVAKEQAKAAITTTQIDESSEIMSIIDRPFLRIRDKSGNTEVQLDISLQTLMGLFAITDMMSSATKKQRYQNIEIFQALAGYAPLGQTSIYSQTASENMQASSPADAQKAAIDWAIGQVMPFSKIFGIGSTDTEDLEEFMP